MRDDVCIDAFQSTRPHGARLRTSVIACPLALVSIHAPARGATLAGSKIGARVGEFQSTRPHGARRAINTWSWVCACFNPRARTGRDQEAHVCKIPGRCVSIHAPARGATTPCHRLPGCAAVSIHAPARGATCAACGIAWPVPMFQSTRPHGARQQRHAFWSSISIRFNPRARTGRDDRYTERVLYECVSIHAPARGATHARGWQAGIRPGFNPRARTGRDLCK